METKHTTSLVAVAHDGTLEGDSPFYVGHPVPAHDTSNFESLYTEYRNEGHPNAEGVVGFWIVPDIVYQIARDFYPPTEVDGSVEEANAKAKEFLKTKSIRDVLR